MFSWLVKFILRIAALKALKRQGELAYLKALSHLRKGLRLALLLFVLSQVLVCGLALSLYAFFQLIPMDEAQRPYWMLTVGMLLFWVPLLMILWGTSDKLWFKVINNRYRDNTDRY